MSHRIIPCEQGTPEWHMARAGVITASTFSEAVSQTSTLSDQQRLYLQSILAGKTEEEARAAAGYKAPPRSEALARALKGEPTMAPSAISNALCDILAFERISEEPYGDTYQTQAMKRGSEEEMWARVRYEQLYDIEIVESGLALTEDGLFGYSTDGARRGERSGIEIKTPASAVKLRELVTSLDMAEYEHQVQGGMWVRGWDFVDVIIWMPQLAKVRNEMLVKRVYRDDNFIDAMVEQLLEFNARVEEAVKFWSTPFRRDGLEIDDDTMASRPIERAVLREGVHKLDTIDVQAKVVPTAEPKKLSSPLAALLLD